MWCHRSLVLYGTTEKRQMACVYPMAQFDTGKTNPETGKALYIKRRSFSDVLWLDGLRGKVDVSSHVIRWRNGHACLLNPVPIPCGKCVSCLMSAAGELSTRVCLEVPYWSYSYFVTLTYFDGSLPIDKSTGQAVLCKPDLCAFHDRLRYYLGKYRFLMCGEYGQRTARPHYHAIILCNEPLPLNQFAINKFTSPLLSRIWSFGLHEVSESTPGCIAYVAGYVLKKAKLVADDDDHQPFRIMSRGLGFRYLETHDVIGDRFVYGDFGPECKRRKVPAAFVRKLESQGVDVEEFKEWNKVNGERMQDHLIAAYNTTDLDELGGKRRAKLSSKMEKSRKEYI